MQIVEVEMENCLFCNSSLSSTADDKKDKDDHQQYRDAFETFINILTSIYFTDLLLSTCNVRKESLVFCSNCSEILINLVTLHDLLDQTRKSIERNIDLILKNVAEADKDSSCEESTGTGKSNDIRVLRHKILEVSNYSKKTSDLQLTEGSRDIHDEFQADVIDEEIEIKIEDFNDLYDESQAFNRDDELEDNFMQSNNSDSTKPACNEVDFFPDESYSDSKTRSDSKISKKRVRKAAHSKTKAAAFANAKINKTRRDECLGMVELKDPLERKEAMDSISTEKGNRPSRNKRKSVRLNYYTDPNSIHKFDKLVSKSKVPRIEPTLTESDKILLTQWGLDKLPQVHIVLQDVYETTNTNFKSQLHKYQGRFIKKTTELPVDVLQQANFEHDEHTKFKSETLSFTPKLDAKAKSKSTSQRCRRVKKMKAIESENDDEVDSANDADFEPGSDSSNSGYEDQPGDEDSDGDKKIKEKSRSKTLKKSDSSTSRNIKLNKVGSTEQQKGPTIFRRCRLRLSSSSISIIDGKMFFQNREIVDKNNHWYCCFEDCNFKAEKTENLHRTSKKLMSHIKDIHRGDCKYQCLVCNSLFENTKLYHIHYAENHANSSDLSIPSIIPTLEELVVECKICTKPLKCYLLEAHHWTHLNEQERAEWISFGKQDPREKERLKKAKRHLKYQCEECNKRFSQMSTLRAHKLTHIEKSKRKKIICEICGDVFTTERGFNLHQMKIHKPDELLGKWTICHICDKKFLVKTHYTRHMMMHHKAEKPYACDNCDRRFTCKYDLKRHTVVHLPVDYRPFKCPHCLMAYRYRKNLNRHIKVSHNDKCLESQKLASVNSSQTVITCKQMFPCEICERVYPLPSRLKKHMKTSHGLIEEKVISKDNVVDNSQIIIDQVQENVETEIQSQYSQSELLQTSTAYEDQFICLDQESSNSNGDEEGQHTENLENGNGTATVTCQYFQYNNN